MMDQPAPTSFLPSDVVKDVEMTNPGTSSCHLPGLSDLGVMFDNQIEQLGKLKGSVIAVQRESSERIAWLERELSEAKRKGVEKSKEILKLKQHVKELQLNQVNGDQPTSTGSLVSRKSETDDWKLKCEELQRRFKDLEMRLQMAQSRGDEVDWPHSTGPAGTVLPAASGNGGGGGNSHQRPREKRQNSQEESLVTDSQRLFLSENISPATVKQFLRRLGVLDINIEHIFYSNTRDAQECCIQGIKSWQQDKGRLANVGALVQTLWDQRIRSVAEEFCTKFQLEELLEKIEQESNDGSSPTSEFDPTVRQVSVGDDAADSGGFSPTAPTCPPTAAPVQRVLWPCLLVKTSIDDLYTDLEAETAPFTPEQVQEFAKRLNLRPGPDKDRFIKVAGDGDAQDVLDAWASLELDRLHDQSNAPCPDLRKLTKVLRKLQKKDVRKILLKYLESGVLGPWLAETVLLRDHKQVQYVDFMKIARKLSEEVAVLPNWRHFASEVGFSEHIPIWEQQKASKLPGEQVLRAWQTGKNTTIEFLYDWAVRSERMDIVKILEEDMSKQ